MNEQQHYEPMEAALRGAVVLTVLALGIICLVVTLLFVARENTPEEAQPSESGIFSEDCSFHRKVQGGDLTIEEPAGGAYRYEVYATSEGIEVWKCNKF